MAVRKIVYTVDESGISPATVQPCGVQREHKATELVFNIANELYGKLLEQAGNGKLVYRFDGYNGEGSVENYDTTDLTSSSVSFLPEEKLTRYGGVIKVVLVITLVVDEKTEMELYSFPALLRLKTLPEGRTVESSENYESISTLSEIAKESSDAAEKAAEIATEAMEKTEFAKAALENGTEWVFDGGGASGGVEINFAVDTEMSDLSSNAIANKTVKQYVDNNLETIEKRVSDAEEKIKADYIVEQGTDGMWTYRKWSSGISECWTMWPVNVIPQNSWGNAHFYDSVGPYTFPRGMFMEIPLLSISISDEGGNITVTRRNPTTENTGIIYAVSMVQSTTEQIAILNIYAKGR